MPGQTFQIPEKLPNGVIHITSGIEYYIHSHGGSFYIKHGSDPLTDADRLAGTALHIKSKSELRGYMSKNSLEFEQ